MFDRVIWKLPGAKRAFAVACGIALLQAILIVLCAVSLGTVLYHLWYAQSFDLQGKLLVLFAASFLMLSVLRSLQDRYFFQFANKACDRLRQQLLEKTFDEGLSLTATIGTAALTTLILEDLDAIHTYARNLLPRMANAIVITLVCVLVLWFIDWVSGLIALLMLPVIGIFMSLLGSMSQKAATSQRGVYEQLSNAFADALKGLATLKRLGISKTWETTIAHTSERFRAATMKVLRVAILSGSVLDLISTLALAAVAVMLGFRLTDGSINLLAAFMVLILVPDCFKPIRAFASDFHSSLDGKNALTTIYTLLSTQTKTHTANTHQSTHHPAPHTPHVSAHDLTVSLEDISFRYTPDAPPVFTHLTASFSSPAVIGIIGPSGVGKSTLTSLLAGFFTPDSGTISVVENGHCLTSDEWRKEVLYIPQHPFIFHGTLRDNIRFYTPHATDEQLRAALHTVGLDSFYATLDKGLDTVIGEAARQLSGGEAHRIALSRALLDTSRRILIFDEPTAHLDIETEIALKAPMQALMKDRLVFFGTHRLHWIDTFDEVFRVEQGSLQSIDKHKLQGTLQKGSGE